MFAFLAVLAGIAFCGIRQSSAVNVFCTILEAGGLLFVVGAGLLFLRQPGNVGVVAMTDWTWVGVLQGGALAFFAFIGFEDMVNVAEEVEEPKRNLPAAILIALSIAAIIYMLVAWVVTSVVPTDVLANSQAPLLEVVRRTAPRVPDWSFACVALFAVTNTGLLNLVMGSRLLYGMAGQGLLPGSLHAVHRKTQTPHHTIGLMFVAALTLAFSGTLPHLAGTTNVLLLLVFFTVNVSLIVLRVRELEPTNGFRVPLILPTIGAISSLGLIAFVPRASLLMASILIGIGVTVVAVWAWKQRRDAILRT